MSHTLEPATSGRAKCRGCEQKIAKGEVRFGERLPNAFGEGEMTLWYHPLCAAYKRPEAFLAFLNDPQGLQESGVDLPDRSALEAAASFGVEHRRVPRVNGAERATTGRARCRQCRETIDKDTWRISLVYYEEGRFEPSGFIHAGCASEYFGTTELVDRAGHFNPDLGPDDRADLEKALA